MAVYVDQMRLMDALTAEEICHVDLRDAFRARFGNPYAVVHRAICMASSSKPAGSRPDRPARELRSPRLRSGRRVGDGTARLRQRVTGSLLIGADGLWSNIRKSVIGDGPPRVSGHTTIVR